MPSRAESKPASLLKPDATVRERIELALRLAALTALFSTLLLVSGAFNADSKSSTAPVVFRGDSIVKAGASPLLGLVRSALLDNAVPGVAPRGVHLLVARVPSDTNRALLTAAQWAGVPVSWTDSTKGAAVAVEARALIDPRGGYSLRVAAPDSARIAFRDSLGLIDSATASGGGASVEVGRVAGSVTASGYAARAATIPPRRAEIRRVLVFAEPGWESKFTVAALEERGWNVEVRYAIGKNVTVTQGSPTTPDTSRYAAVIALDSSVLPHIAGIRRYAQSGGGVVIAGAAITLREFGEMLPGRAGSRQPGVPGGLETDTPLVGLGWRPIAPDTNAAIIARSPRKLTGASDAAVIARRFGAGRVVESAYDGVWEWRMAGPEGSVEAHRAWWSDLVSAAAYAPEQTLAANGANIGQTSDIPGPAAPYADLRVRLGHPTAVPISQASAGYAMRSELLLALMAFGCLLAEWASRRLRGAK